MNFHEVNPTGLVSQYIPERHCERIDRKELASKHACVVSYDRYISIPNNELIEWIVSQDCEPVVSMIWHTGCFILLPPETAVYAKLRFDLEMP